MVYLDLYNGDCLEVMKDLSANSIDLFICDLPYGCLGPLKKGGGIPRPDTEGAFGGCNWDIPIDLDQFWTQVKRLAKNEHTPVLMFCTTRFGFDLIKSNPSWFRYDIVWEKTNAVGFLTANKMPMRSHEMIYVFAKSGAFYQRKDIEGDFKFAGGGRSKQNVYAGDYELIQPDNEGKRCVKSVVKIANKKQKGGHPTQKPSELYEWLMDRYSEAGGTVLDPTAGSFTSCFTAYKMNRNAIGIEKDEAFYKKACEVADSL